MKEGGTIDVLSSFSFYEALTILIDNKISSAPIMDVNTNKYIGFVDMIDLATAIVDILEANNSFETMKEANAANRNNNNSKAEETKETGKGSKGKDNQSKKKKDKKKKSTTQKEASTREEEIKKRREREYVEDDEDPFAEALLLNSVSVKSLSDASQRDPFLWVNENDSLVKVAELLKDHHRIAVMDEQQKLRGVITQSGFMEYLNEEHGLWLDKISKRVKDLHLPSIVHSVHVRCRAIDALKMMKEKKVTGLAVVNNDGNLVDVVSASDLMVWSEWSVGGHALRFRYLSALTLELKEFLENSRSQRSGKTNAPSHPVICRGKTPVSEAVSLMLEHNIHRLFIINSQNQPKSVVTYGDLIYDLIFPGKHGDHNTSTSKDTQLSKQS
jgi:CBS domain-containing protein